MRARINLTVTFLNLPSETVHDVVVRFVPTSARDVTPASKSKRTAYVACSQAGRAARASTSRTCIVLSIVHYEVPTILRDTLLSFGITPLLVNQSGLN